MCDTPLRVLISLGSQRGILRGAIFAQAAAMACRPVRWRRHRQHFALRAVGTAQKTKRIERSGPPSRTEQNRDLRETCSLPPQATVARAANLKSPRNPPRRSAPPHTGAMLAACWPQRWPTGWPPGWPPGWPLGWNVSRARAKPHASAIDHARVLAAGTANGRTRFRGIGAGRGRRLLRSHRRLPRLTPRAPE
jgi:hypothetical protein